MPESADGLWWLIIVIYINHRMKVAECRCCMSGPCGTLALYEFLQVYTVVQMLQLFIFNTKALSNKTIREVLKQTLYSG
jgi:hypothetical protein